MKKLINEQTIGIILIALAILCLNPFNFFMPSPMVSMLIVIVIAVFSIFAATIWKEKPHDEREAFHGMLAGRYAFLVGSGILVIGILYQTHQHAVDPWLVIALTGMLLAKIGGLLYGQKKY